MEATSFGEMPVCSVETGPMHERCTAVMSRVSEASAVQHETSLPASAVQHGGPITITNSISQQSVSLSKILPRGRASLPVRTGHGDVLTLKQFRSRAVVIGSEAKCTTTY